MTDGEGEGLAEAAGAGGCGEAEATGADPATGWGLDCALGLGDAGVAGLGEAEGLAELEADEELAFVVGELEAPAVEAPVPSAVVGWELLLGAGLMLLALDDVVTPAGCGGGSGCTETDGWLAAGAEALPLLVLPVDPLGELLLVVAAGAELGALLAGLLAVEAVLELGAVSASAGVAVSSRKATARAARVGRCGMLTNLTIGRVRPGVVRRSLYSLGRLWRASIGTCGSPSSSRVEF